VCVCVCVCVYVCVCMGVYVGVGVYGRESTRAELLELRGLLVIFDAQILESHCPRTFT
jgi:hypothetical protein